MNLQQGAVVLIRFPFTDHKSSKVRPAIIVSGKTFNRGNDLLLVPVTTQLLHSPFTLLLSQHDLSRGHLEKKSFIKCGNLTVFDKSLVRKIIAELKPSKLKLVLNSSQRAFE